MNIPSTSMVKLQKNGCSIYTDFDGTQKMLHKLSWSKILITSAHKSNIVPNSSIQNRTYTFSQTYVHKIPFNKKTPFKNNLVVMKLSGRLWN